MDSANYAPEAGQDTPENFQPEVDTSAHTVDAPVRLTVSSICRMTARSIQSTDRGMNHAS
jgi:hypothetical protein